MKREIIIALTVLLGFNVGCKKKSENYTKPNILFLFADDYTYNAVRLLGNNNIETPNIDRLVKSGTTFTHAYNMGGWNGAVCVASRSMIISGKSIWNAKKMDERWRAKDTTALNATWGKLMETGGYDTYMSGKWHVQAPADYVFQNAKNVKRGMPFDNLDKDWGVMKKIGKAYKENKPYAHLLPLGYGRPTDENDTSWSPTDSLQGGYWQGGKHWSEVLKDDAIGFIEAASQKNTPFFMYLAFNAPHDPRQAPQSFLDKYKLEDIPLPKNWLPEYPYKDGMGNPVTLRDEALAPFPRTPYAIKTHIKEYYAIISHLDEQIGKILDALEASGKADNTYIFFTGDHGLSVGHHGLMGKQSMFDHSIRVPLIVSGPEIPQGQKIDADVYLQDIMATSLELADVQNLENIDFNSFLSLAKGETEKSYLHKGVYGAYMGYQRMIRKEGYKLIVYPDIDKVLLFNIKDDPLEMNDLADDPENKEKAGQLFKDLMELQNEMKDPLDLNPLYQKNKYEDL